jgi:hypothetical protein
MKRSGGGIEVRAGADLLRELDTLLNDPEKRRRVGEKAYTVAMIDGTVVERSMDLLARYVSLPAQREARPAGHETRVL